MENFKSVAKAKENAPSQHRALQMFSHLVERKHVVFRIAGDSPKRQRALTEMLDQTRMSQLVRHVCNWGGINIKIKLTESIEVKDTSHVFPFLWTYCYVNITHKGFASSKL